MYDDLTLASMFPRIIANHMPNPPSMFRAPAVPRAALPDPSYVQPTLSHALRIWWAYYWPASLISGVLSFGVEFVLKTIYQNSSVSGDVIRYVMFAAPLMITYTVAIFVIHYILNKTFRHFRINLVSNRGEANPQVVERSFRRTIRVWWTFTWRSLLYYAIASVVVILPLSFFVGIFRPGPVFSKLFGMLLGTVVGGAVALFVFYSNILDEGFGDFRVYLTARQPDIPAVTDASASHSASL